MGLSLANSLFICLCVFRQDPLLMSPLLILVGLGLGSYLAVWRNKRALKVKAKRRR